MEITAAPLASVLLEKTAAPRRHQLLDQAVDQFESLFTGVLLRESLTGEGLVADGPGREIIQGLIQDAFAREIAKTGALSIGSSMRDQFHSRIGEGNPRP